jgi:hypothetical protein
MGADGHNFHFGRRAVSLTTYPWFWAVAAAQTSAISGKPLLRYDALRL